MSFTRGVVDVGAKRLQRHAAFTVPLVTGNVCTVETAGRLHLDAESAEAHGILHGALHRAAEHHALFELLRDAVSDELSVKFRTANFFDVDVNRHAHHLLNFSLKSFNISALLANHDARTSREDRDARIVGRTFDENAGDGRIAELLQKEGANLQIFLESARVIAAVRVPTRRPVARNREAEAGGINFLTHGNSPVS